MIIKCMDLYIDIECIHTDLILPLVNSNFIFFKLNDQKLTQSAVFPDLIMHSDEFR